MIGNVMLLLSVCLVSFIKTIITYLQDPVSTHKEIVEWQGHSIQTKSRYLNCLMLCFLIICIRELMVFTDMHVKLFVLSDYNNVFFLRKELNTQVYFGNSDSNTTCRMSIIFIVKSSLFKAEFLPLIFLVSFHC